MKKNNVEKLDIKQLYERVEYISKKSKKDIKVIAITCVVLTIVFSVVCILLVDYHLEHNTQTSITPDMLGYVPIILGFAVGLFAFIYTNIAKKIKNGRSSIDVPVNLSENKADVKMRELLKNLYYTETEFKGEKYFYAYKDAHFGTNATSKPRCIAYTYKDGVITIEAWAGAKGIEQPIDNRRYGEYCKDALTYDLVYIVENINK